MKRAAPFGVVAIGAALACSSTMSGEPASEPDAAALPMASEADAAEPCSTGPTHPNDYNGWPHVYDPKQYPKCTPHCGATDPKLSSGYLGDALPSGACSGKVQDCTMGIGIMCCGAPYGPIEFAHVMHCYCNAGAWVCVIAQQGAGGCSCKDASASD